MISSLITILAFESSCDDTSVCVMRDKKILSLVTDSQIDSHTRFGGVVPEIAGREHCLNIPRLTHEALKQAQTSIYDIDLIAVTAKPGLVGSLLVGLTFARGLATGLSKPIIELDHLDGHIFTTYLTDNLENNYYMLLISGGHSQMMLVRSLGDYVTFGHTLDDAVGEVFDKISKMMGLGYPGGPIIEKLALSGDPNRFLAKIPLKGKHDFNFSFSGLKTFFLRAIERIKLENSTLSQQDICDVAASFQSIATKTLIDRAKNMILATLRNPEITTPPKYFVLSGGVASNDFIRKQFEILCFKFDIALVTPPRHLCTDNAAMIGGLATLEIKLNRTKPYITRLD